MEKLIVIELAVKVDTDIDRVGDIVEKLHINVDGNDVNVYGTEIVDFYED